MSKAGPSVEYQLLPKKDALPKRILRSQRNIRHVLKFTNEEDDFLKEGIAKHGFGQWTAILNNRMTSMIKRLISKLNMHEDACYTQDICVLNIIICFRK